MTADLPPGWTAAEFGDLVESKSGNSKLIKGKLFSAAEAGLVPAYSASGQDVWCEHAEWEVDGVVLSAVGARCGKTFLARGRWTAIANTHVLVPAPGIDTRWLWYLTNNEDFWVKGGSAQPFVKMKLSKGIPVSVPPLAEQRRIVVAIDEHFSRLDAFETSIAVADGRLHALYRSVAVDAFDRPGWDWTTLGEIAEVKGGITKDSKRETTPEFEEFPYLRVANVQRGYLDLSKITTIRSDRHKAQRLVLRPGDILFNEGGDRDKLGRGWVWEGQIENCIHQNHVFRARLLDDRFDPYFVSLHANSWGQKWFESHGKQTTNLASLNLTTLKSFPVPAPSAQVQRTVASHMRSALDSVQHQRLELGRVAARASSLRRSILAEAFAGRLVPQHPVDDPAPAVLKRETVPTFGQRLGS